MRYTLASIFFSFCTLGAFAQMNNLYPVSTKLLPFSETGEQAFNTKTPDESFHRLDVYKMPQIDTAANGTSDTTYVDTILNFYQNYWDVIGPGCSWYCGGRVDTVTASSSLRSQDGITYVATNVADLSYKTAWVEGAKSTGTGEYLEFRFSPESARVEEVLITNGQVKSEKAWKENGRVKKLKLYYNGKLHAILNLKDERSEQIFQVGPFGYDYFNLDDDKKPVTPWTLRFEIFEVYPGTRNTDTAISEIHFMGSFEH